MAKRKNMLPYTPIGEFMQEKSQLRIGQDAKIEAEAVLDELCERIISQAVLICEHSRRSTLNGEDIKLAHKQISK